MEALNTEAVFSKKHAYWWFSYFLLLLYHSSPSGQVIVSYREEMKRRCCTDLLAEIKYRDQLNLMTSTTLLTTYSLP